MVKQTRMRAPISSAVMIQHITLLQVGSSGAAKGSKTGCTVTIEVRKPEGLVGQLTIGPLKPNQRCIFGRIPSNDVVRVYGVFGVRNHTQGIAGKASGGLSAVSITHLSLTVLILACHDRWSSTHPFQDSIVSSPLTWARVACCSRICSRVRVCV